MQISESFKQAQRATFQDKIVSHRLAVETKGALGSVTVNPGPVVSTYLVNFQLISDALLAQEWGLIVSQDAFITSSDPLPIANGEFIQFAGRVYKVVGKPDHDSHNKLMLKFQQGIQAV